MSIRRSFETELDAVAVVRLLKAATSQPRPLFVALLLRGLANSPFVGAVEANRFAVYPVTRFWPSLSSVPLITGVVQARIGGATVAAEASAPVFPPPLLFPLAARSGLRRLELVIGGTPPEQLTPHSGVRSFIIVGAFALAALLILTVVLGR